VEQVYVLPVERFPAASNKLIELEQSLFVAIENDGIFMPRNQAENDPSFRQIIPYVVLKHQPSNQYFLMRRKKGGGESRLHNRYTLGVGGHINPEDKENVRPLLVAASFREFQEEIGFPKKKEGEEYTANDILAMSNAQKLILFDENPVDRVHAGIVFIMKTNLIPFVRETEKLEGELATLDQIRAVYDDLEGWSKLVFKWLEENG
jgi:predicted NUDIX family phosphoesterase